MSVQVIVGVRTDGGVAVYVHDVGSSIPTYSMQMPPAYARFLAGELLRAAITVEAIVAKRTAKAKETDEEEEEES